MWQRVWRRHRQQANERGDLGVDFVLLFPIAFGLTMLTVFMSWWITQHSVVAEAARAGARAVAESGYAASATVPARTVLIDQHAFPNTIHVSAAVINSPDPACAEAAGTSYVAEYAQVRVSASMNNFLDFLFDPAFFSGAGHPFYLPITSTVRVPVETEWSSC
jgi:Flp pilus assembly protein TadG